jgi:hypothetical protein
MAERKRVAYHEAVHAVSAVRFGRDYFGADIFNDGNEAGPTFGHGTWDGVNHRLLGQMVVPGDPG